MTRLRFLTISVALLATGILALGFAFAHVSVRVTSDEYRTTGALCALRADLQTRVTSGESFLKTHPKGFAGISRPVIESSLSGQRHTIRALALLICPRSGTTPKHPRRR
jgi:hypothetical protein